MINTDIIDIVQKISYKKDGWTHTPQIEIANPGVQPAKQKYKRVQTLVSDIDEAEVIVRAEDSDYHDRSPKPLLNDIYGKPKYSGQILFYDGSIGGLDSMTSRFIFERAYSCLFGAEVIHVDFKR